MAVRLKRVKAVGVVPGVDLEWRETRLDSRGRGKTTVTRERACIKVRQVDATRAEGEEREGTARRSMRVSIGSWLTAYGL